MTRRTRSLYYGWYITAALGLILTVVVGSTLNAFGLFVLPVSTEFGLSRADINSAFILLNIGIAVIAPFIGRALDRFPAKRIMLIAILCLGISFGVLSISRSLWLSSLVMLVPLPIAFLAAGTITYSIVLARWFAVQRGRAIMLAQVGAPLGSVTVTPLVAWLIEVEGWRTALATMAGVGTVVLLLLLTVIRERPGPGESETGVVPDLARSHPAAAAEPQRPATVKELLGTSLFWMTAFGYALPICMAQAMAVTLVPLAMESGIATTQAASLVSISGAAAIFGNLSMSVVADRFDRTKLLVAFALLGVGMGALPLLEHSYILLAITSAIIGLSTGTMAPIFYATFADRFGVPSFGTVRGLIQPISAVMNALAVRFAGEVFDRTGEYALLFQVMIAVQLIAAILIYFTGNRTHAAVGAVAMERA